MGTDGQLLSGIRVVEVGHSLAVSVCGRLYVELGARVWCERSGSAPALNTALDRGKTIVDPPLLRHSLIENADVLISAGAPREAERVGRSPAQLRAWNPDAIIVHVSPFGLYGPRAHEHASDLTLFAASGIAQLLIGQVDDVRNEPPQRAVGGQSNFIGGIAAACASVIALCRHKAGDGGGPLIDVSEHEALATLAITELTRAANGKLAKPRTRTTDGNGATVCILPCADGYVAISPREQHQWQAWLAVMGQPSWGDDPRFLTKADRIANWDALYAHLSRWSAQRPRDAIAERAQAAHVPSFALREPHEHLESAQLRARDYFTAIDFGGQTLMVPRSPFGVSSPHAGEPRAAPKTKAEAETGAAARLPLAGVRVLDFSWVIAGPTTTRYLAAMGADVIKVEAPGRGDPGRASELHAVLGQAKRSIVLDLKNPAGARIARQLASASDVLIENFATGVMERFGLDANRLQADNPALIYVSASGMGREGPQSKAVAYGTLLQCYSGFAALNAVPGKPPRVGMAWLDPMCGLLLAFVSAAAVHRRGQHGTGVRVDFSMLEAMLWSMLAPLIDCQLGAPGKAIGNASLTHSPHGIFAAHGDDAWIAIAVRSDWQWQALSRTVPALAALAALSLDERQARRDELERTLGEWCAQRPAQDLQEQLQAAGIAAAAVADANDLARCPHLAAREFWDRLPSGMAPGLPWRSTLGRVLESAPALGVDTAPVLREVLGLNEREIDALRADGAFG